MASPVELDIAKHLLGVGCCERCSLRLLNNLPNELINFANIEDDLIIVRPSEMPSKKAKPNPCIACLDILRDQSLRNMFDEKLTEEIKKYDCDTFTISLTVPDCCVVREYTLAKYIKQTFPEYTSDFPLTYKTNRISFAFRSSIQKELEAVMGKKYKKDSPLHLNVVFTHKDDHKEIRKVMKLDKSVKFWGRRAILKTLYLLSDEDLKVLYPISSAIPDGSAILKSTQVEHSAIYLMGRFVKYAKQLPVTKVDTPDPTYCLQTLLETFISDKFRTPVTNISFHTCVVPLSECTLLGLGKPFICKIVDSKLSKLSPSEAFTMENECNELHARNGFAVRDFQIDYKDQLENLKHHALISQKHCVIICSVRSAELLDETINTLNELQMPIVINQWQPNCGKRFVKFVKKLVASRVQGNEVSFYLEILGSPGLHIADFLLNDTNPSLEQLASTKLTIHRVDIFEECEQWPPVVTPNVESFRARYQMPSYMCENDNSYIKMGCYLQDVVIYKQQFGVTGRLYEDDVSSTKSISLTNYDTFVHILKESILVELRMLGYLTEGPVKVEIT